MEEKGERYRDGEKVSADFLQSFMLMLKKQLGTMVLREGYRAISESFRLSANLRCSE